MSTLYDVLEVSEKASKEVIEKAYRVLAKKYHPDLQTPENRAMAESKMKEINDAYDILSDDAKRKEYDEKLAREKEIKEQQKASQTEYYSQPKSSNSESQYTQQQYSQSQYYQAPNSQNQYYTNGATQEEQRYRDIQRRKYEAQLQKQQEQMRKQMEQQMQQEYQNAYYNYLRSLGYRIKEKWTWKKTKQLILTILIMIGIFMTLWFIPPTHDMMVEFYESNRIVKIIVDILWGTIKAIFQTIWEIIVNIFT